MGKRILNFYAYVHKFRIACPMVTKYSRVSFYYGVTFSNIWL